MISVDDSAAVKARRRLTGVAFLLVLCLLVWLSIAAYQKRFTDVAMVTLRTDSVGNEMHSHADVKMRGQVIGEVRDISADGSGARLRLALQPGALKDVPANVTAQMLPTTLFGERYVALVPPPDPAPVALTAGSVIGQDRSSNAIELERVLDNVLPLLTAVRPDKLSATLTAIAQALQGRGEELGRTLVDFDSYLGKTNPQLPALDRDITELVRVAQAYSQASPDILQALTDFTTTSRTIVDQRANLGELYDSVTDSSRDITAFLRANSANIIRLSADSRPVLETLARYSPSFPCTLKTLSDFVPAMDRALGKGTDRHGMHVTVRVVPSKGKYVPGRDTPVYNADGGPHCYSVPYQGAAGALGVPNSPGENDLVNELLNPGGTTPQKAPPDWSSVLVGPIYRGTEVTVK
ncbi:MCE family protein [Actinoallomurus iriomotensis]|uniref:ABC transporter substrate-binding protein n=1 Tax=Actinoallomurus iriomotensis TaxID=478107 RepID=A0A9W6RSM4_9ACTN|nr:MCE family protein [Actinoallomurus iriomotensis]GLY80925.1 ABC transporter substrate-binding protein [Actinoallomurus iriomotensis]GLY88704.1 ABC transporter substrate-binding protein [Actinoallomurus iriomotensis]